jgi:hypothetical protein
MGTYLPCTPCPVCSPPFSVRYDLSSAPPFSLIPPSPLSSYPCCRSSYKAEREQRTLANANTLSIALEGARPRSRGGWGRRDVVRCSLHSSCSSHGTGRPLRFCVEPGGCAARPCIAEERRARSIESTSSMQREGPGGPGARAVSI